MSRAGEAEFRLGKPLRATARLRGQSLILQVQGLQKLMLQDVEASLRADSAGTTVLASATPVLQGGSASLTTNMLQPGTYLIGLTAGGAYRLTVN